MMGSVASLNFRSLILLLLVLTSFNLVAAQQPQNYINNYIGIQLDYPASWVHFDSTQFPYVFFFPANEYQSDVFPTLQSVSFAVSKDWTISEQDLTLESYLQQAKTHFSNSSFVDLGEPERITFRDGLPAYEWTSKSDKEMSKILTIVTVSNGTPYQIIYKASLDKYDQYLLLASGMISSLHFLNSVR
jgi:hypothetical protein